MLDLLTTHKYLPKAGLFTLLKYSNNTGKDVGILHLHITLAYSTFNNHNSLNQNIVSNSGHILERTLRSSVYKGGMILWVTFWSREEAGIIFLTVDKTICYMTEFIYLFKSRTIYEKLLPRTEGPSTSSRIQSDPDKEPLVPWRKHPCIQRIIWMQDTILRVATAFFGRGQTVQTGKGTICWTNVEEQENGELFQSGFLWKGLH